MFFIKKTISANPYFFFLKFLMCLRRKKKRFSVFAKVVCVDEDYCKKLIIQNIFLSEIQFLQIFIFFRNFRCV